MIFLFSYPACVSLLFLRHEDTRINTNGHETKYYHSPKEESRKHLVRLEFWKMFNFYQSQIN